MKIFLSWSGPTSRAFAHKMSEFLSQVLPWSEVYLSDDEIDSGERWLLNISGALDGSSYGIILLTNENKVAPWVLFEAGALSKHISESRVVPLLCDIEDIDLTGNPLSQFQYRKLNKSDLERLIKDISAKSDVKVVWDRVQRTFEKFWPDYEPEFQTLQAASPAPEAEGRDGGQAKSSKAVTRAEIDQIQDSLNEILRAVRTTGRASRPKETSKLVRNALAHNSDINMVDFDDDVFYGEYSSNGSGYLKRRRDGEIVSHFYYPEGPYADWRRIFEKAAQRVRDEDLL